MSCNKPRSTANTPLANCNTRPSPPPPTKTAKSRADVQAELAQAKASGQYTFGELEYPPIVR